VIPDRLLFAVLLCPMNVPNGFNAVGFHRPDADLRLAVLCVFCRGILGFQYFPVHVLDCERRKAFEPRTADIGLVGLP